MSRFSLQAALLLLAVLLLVPVSPDRAAFADDSLELWIHPYLPATEIHRRFDPLRTYLEKMAGRKVFLRVSKDYEDHIRRVGLNEADIAYMGPIPYVQVVNQYGPKPLLASLEVNGTPYFHSVIAVYKDSPFTGLSDLTGKSVAFCDCISTMGFLIPRYLLQKESVYLEDLGSYRHLKTHEDVALAVIGGYFDAGGIKEEVFEKYRDRGLKALAVSPPMQEHLFVTRSDLDPGTVALLRKVLLELSGAPGTATVLTAIKETVTGLIPVEDADYDIYRNILEALELSPADSL